MAYLAAARVCRVPSVARSLTVGHVKVVAVGAQRCRVLRLHRLGQLRHVVEAREPVETAEVLEHLQLVARLRRLLGLGRHDVVEATHCVGLARGIGVRADRAVDSQLVSVCDQGSACLAMPAGPVAQWRRFVAGQRESARASSDSVFESRRRSRKHRHNGGRAAGIVFSQRRLCSP